MQNALRVPFNRWQLLFAGACYLVFYGYLAMNYAEEVFHILPAKSGTVDPVVRYAATAFAIIWLPKALRHFRMLLTSSPAVVIDANGIQAFPWNGNIPLKWAQIKDVTLIDRSLSFRKGRAFRFLKIEGRDGQKLKIESHIIRRKDWLMAYQSILEQAPSFATQSLLPLEDENPDRNDMERQGNG